MSGILASAETIKAIVGLFTGLAWPVVVGLIAWRFQNEIARLIDRISSLKAFGTELEAKGEVNQKLETAREGLSEDTIRNIEAAVATSKVEAAAGTNKVEGKVDITGTATGSVISASDLELTELAGKDPRAAIRQGWERLAKVIL